METCYSLIASLFIFIYTHFRGCLTLDQRQSSRQIAPGYYRSYNGIEQWICATSSCNFDLQKMEDSWPMGLEDYKNISGIEIQNLFDELNMASNTNELLLFIISLLTLTLHID
ncbi:hypothetical protein DICVIV_04850 [Dictyocaulus viviparus]|uniref:DUF7622 domain-containing protein n=1 Tax=Dictyocaulus viviparus TaxID=29172 RepID=A0A0D8XYT6_DICVI|nr:hypothetical protein DICVIV_04850 [Dictyocaulus viviparus]